MLHYCQGGTLNPEFCIGEACRAVVGLIAMIAPLPYSADFRPYFTIHDAAFHELSRGVLPDKSTGLPRLLGVTNLYFLKVALAGLAVFVAKVLRSP